ncbi:NYN domain-containing protein [Microbacterium gorillae]|uniref:NYN domain-containing protein n=1 Tax=Microbacterium gorillae TaxID=1231063 RepID=UPI001E45990A|nr:NYN domain-containing protein [Microbacterium gorillae]
MTTWVLVDGENIDATLGGQILGRRPQPDERPRWDRLLSFAARTWNQEARGVFFLNATTSVPMPFVQALMAMDYRVALLSGAADEKVVDMAIVKTMSALVDRDDAVLLVSNDGDFVDGLVELAESDHRVGVVGFDEFRNLALREVPGIETFDLEYDVHAFDAPLERIRVIPIDRFDPLEFLS